MMCACCTLSQLGRAKRKKAATRSPGGSERRAVAHGGWNGHAKTEGCGRHGSERQTWPRGVKWLALNGNPWPMGPNTVSCGRDVSTFVELKKDQSGLPCPRGFKTATRGPDGVKSARKKTTCQINAL